MARLLRHADAELKSARRSSNGSAAEVLQDRKGYAPENLPCERTMRDVLNRMGYRLKRIRKGRPLRKTAQTDAVCANVEAARAEAKGPETLEISMDTKAKVSEGDYAQAGPHHPAQPATTRANQNLPLAKHE